MLTDLFLNSQSTESVELKVEELESEQAINCLSVRQLKQILDANFVDYKGCFEKRELLERVQRLWTSKKEYEEMKKGKWQRSAHFKHIQ